MIRAQRVKGGASSYIQKLIETNAGNLKKVNHVKIYFFT
jgi:hypothetical protein